MFVHLWVKVMFLHLCEICSDFNASDFNVDYLNLNEFFGSSPIKTEQDSDYDPEGEVESIHEEEVLKPKPKYKNTGGKCNQHAG